MKKDWQKRAVIELSLDDWMVILHAILARRAFIPKECEVGQQYTRIAEELHRRMVEEGVSSVDQDLTSLKLGKRER